MLPVPMEILNRVLKIKTSNGVGTAFTLIRNNRQYLITAKHVVEGIASGALIEIYMNSGPKPCTVDVVGISNSKGDVAVLSPRILITPNQEVICGAEGIVLGQDLYFLGFPFEENSHIKGLSIIPLPFIKKAILSAAQNIDSQEIFWLDGINNPGFSGGPVVFRELESGCLKIAAIISGYRTNPLPLTVNGVATPYSVAENTGLILSYSIDMAFRLIDGNPIGLTRTPGNWDCS